MRFYKLRVTPNAANIASTFNEQFKPEIIQEYNDPFRVDWITEPKENDEVFVGEKVIVLSVSVEFAVQANRHVLLGAPTGRSPSS